MQPMAQKYTTPEHTGLLFALEPVFSAVFSYIFLHETLSGKGYMGAMLVMAGRDCSFCCQGKETAGTRCGTSVLKVNIVLMNRDKSTEIG